MSDQTSMKPVQFQLLAVCGLEAASCGKWGTFPPIPRQVRGGIRAFHPSHF